MKDRQSGSRPQVRLAATPSRLRCRGTRGRRDGDATFVPWS